jgi:hypothetical protein
MTQRCHPSYKMEESEGTVIEIRGSDMFPPLFISLQVLIYHVLCKDYVD